MSSEMTAVDELVQFLRSGKYQGRGREHVDKLATSFLQDLVTSNPTVAEAAQAGELVSERNYEPAAHQFSRDLDLTVGTPATDADDKGTQKQFTTGEPTIRGDTVESVWLALNIESLISSVGKNWKNRGEDIYAFYLTVYDSHNLAVTGAIILLNVASLDQSKREMMVDGYREFEFAEGSIVQNLDALCVLPLEYDETAPGQTSVVEDLVSEDDPLHYTNFVDIMASGLERRLQGDFDVSEETLDSVLAESETEVLEFKERLDDLSDIAKEAVALANHDGGSILIGVDDDGTVKGLPDIDEAEERVTGILKQIEPTVVRNIEKATYDGEDILIVNVDRATTVPASYNGKFTRRQGTSKNPMSGQRLLESFPRE